MTKIEQEQKEKAQEVLLEAKNEEQAKKAFEEAARNISGLTPRERFGLRRKARRKALRLNRASKRAKDAERQRQNALIAKASRQPWTSFVFSPGMKVTVAE